MFPIPLLALLARRRDVSAVLHLMALALLPGAWGLYLAPYAAFFLFFAPISAYGPYLALSYIFAALVQSPLNPLLVPLAAVGFWWLFWKARHLSSAVSIEADPPVLTAGELGTWRVSVRACCGFEVRSDAISFVESSGSGLLETTARAVFRLGAPTSPWWR